MNFVQLENFIMVAKEGNLTRAAAKLNLSQPTLSASISRLEEELGLKLFDRVGRQIVLNKDGKVFLEHAEILICDYRTMLAELDKCQTMANNSVRISFNTYDSQNDIIFSFSSKHPDIYIHQKIETVESDSSIRFPDGSDFYISNNECPGSDLGNVLLSSDDILVIMSREHRLAANSSISFADLIDEKIVINHEGSGYNLYINSLFETSGYSVPYKAYAMPPKWNHYLEKGYIALSTWNYIKAGNFQSCFSFVPLLDERGNSIKRQLRLYWKLNEPMSQSARCFLEYIKQELTV